MSHERAQNGRRSIAVRRRVTNRRTRRRPATTLTLLLGLLAHAVAAQDAAAPFADRVTGDWRGARTNLVERGITFDLETTQYYQGLVSGTGEHDFEYGGRLDAFVDFDTTKLGLWNGGVIRTRSEYSYGDLEPNLGGALVPTNLGVRLPDGGPKNLEMTALHLVQRLGERATLIAGKINTVDLLAADPFFGGVGNKRFWNLAFAAPANGLTPPVIMGGIVSVAASPVAWTFMLFDPNNRFDDYWIDGLFDDGVNVSASGTYRRPIAGRASSFTVATIYSTKDSANLGELLLPPELQTGTHDDSWHASFQFTHLLRESAAGAGVQWGVYAKLGVSDGNPNPYQTFLTGGISGKGLLGARPNDTFGLGFFYYGFSDDLQSTIDPIAEFDDETGIEVFYNLTPAPWLTVGGDLQVVDPGAGANDDAVMLGVRATIRF